MMKSEICSHAHTPALTRSGKAESVVTNGGLLDFELGQKSRQRRPSSSQLETPCFPWCNRISKAAAFSPGRNEDQEGRGTH